MRETAALLLQHPVLLPEPLVLKWLQELPSAVRRFPAPVWKRRRARLPGGRQCPAVCAGSPAASLTETLVQPVVLQRAVVSSEESEPPVLQQPAAVRPEQPEPEEPPLQEPVLPDEPVPSEFPELACERPLQPGA